MIAEENYNRIDFLTPKALALEDIKNIGPELYYKMITNFKDKKLAISPYSHNTFFIKDMIKKFDNGFILIENNEITGIAFLCSFPFSMDIIISIVSDSQIRILKLLKKVKKFCNNKGIYSLTSYVLPFESLVQTFKNSGFIEIEEMFDLIEVSSIKMVLKLK